MKSLLLVIMGLVPEKLFVLAGGVASGQGAHPAHSATDAGALWQKLVEFVNSVPLPVAPWLRWTLASIVGLALLALAIRCSISLIRALGQWPRFGRRRAAPGFLSTCFALVQLAVCYLLIVRALPIPAPYGDYGPYAAYGLLALSALGAILNLINPPGGRELSEAKRRKLEKKAAEKAAAEKAKTDAVAAEEHRKKHEAAEAALNTRLARRGFDFAEDITDALVEAEGYQQNKFYDLAIAGARRVLDLPPDNSAARAYDRDVVPHQFAALLIIGDVYNDAGDNERAREALSRALEIVVQNPARIPRDNLRLCYHIHGFVLSALKDYDAAIGSFGKALEYAGASRYRASLCRARGDARMNKAVSQSIAREGEDGSFNPAERQILDKAADDFLECVRLAPYDDPSPNLRLALRLGTGRLGDEQARQK
ncbi:MAG: tetratricopeptide repeat protein, partial [Opitutaceae bacterium]|nr:tetratricopeptide repeat protein [Opitutaceae bacterium]